MTPHALRVALLAAVNAAFDVIGNAALVVRTTRSAKSLVDVEAGP